MLSKLVIATISTAQALTVKGFWDPVIEAFGDVESKLLKTGDEYKDVLFDTQQWGASLLWALTHSSCFSTWKEKPKSAMTSVLKLAIEPEKCTA